MNIIFAVCLMLLVGCGDDAGKPSAPSPIEVEEETGLENGPEEQAEPAAPPPRQEETVVSTSVILESCGGHFAYDGDNYGYMDGVIEDSEWECVIKGIAGREEAPFIHRLMLFRAIMEGNKKAVELLLAQGMEANGTDPFEGKPWLRYALRVAIHFGVDPTAALNVIQLLLAHGASIENSYDYVDTWLEAVGKSPQLTKAMIDAGMDVNARPNIDQTLNPVTALVVLVEKACRADAESSKEGIVESIKMVIESGADVNTFTFGQVVEDDDDGNWIVVGIFESRSVLDLAQSESCGCPGLVEILKGAGACENLEGRKFVWGRNRGWDRVIRYIASASDLQEPREVDCENFRPGPPAKPSNLMAIGYGETRIKLSWWPPEGEERITGYRIEVSEDGSTWTDLVADSESDATHYEHKGLVGGSRRFYRVSAINSSGVGLPSEVAMAITESISLFEAIESRDIEAVRRLVQSGADVNEMTYSGSTPLHVAIYYGEVEILQILIDAGANPNKNDGSGNSPIHVAVRQDDPEILRTLVEGGANVNEKDALGNPAIQVAVVRNMPEMVQILIDAGGDPNETNHLGNPMIHEALIHGNTEVVRILVDAGADVNAHEKSSRFSVREGVTPLLTAVSYDYLEIVRILIDAGAEVLGDGHLTPSPFDEVLRIGDSEMLTVFLFWAIREKDAESIIRLLKEGRESPNINARNTSGDTPLHAAIRNGSSALIVTILVVEGANVHATDASGQTPLQLALEVDASDDIVQILTEAEDQ